MLTNIHELALARIKEKLQEEMFVTVDEGDFTGSLACTFRFFSIFLNSSVVEKAGVDKILESISSKFRLLDTHPHIGFRQVVTNKGNRINCVSLIIPSVYAEKLSNYSMVEDIVYSAFRVI